VQCPARSNSGDQFDGRPITLTSSDDGHAVNYQDRVKTIDHTDHSAADDPDVVL
jgi:hypothetical protein